MSLEQTLQKVIGSLNSGSLDSEAQVKAAVVLPVLRNLGWDDSDPNTFKPEFAVDRRFVDYALLDHGEPLVFIEAKHASAKLGKGETQLFGYASHRGVPLLVLTNGWYWDFYLSMAAGLPADRRFCRIDLHFDDKILDYVGFLEEHLRRGRVVSGQAKLSAEEILQNKRKRERARSAIPDAWGALVEDRDEMLRELLAERVESDCGAKPDTADVDAFLTSLQPRGSGTAHKPSPPGGHTVAPPVSPVSKGAVRIKGFILRGDRVACKTALDTLAAVLNSFQRENSGFLDRLAPRTTRPTRRLVAKNQVDLYDNARYAKKCRKLEDGWWLGTHYGLRTIRRDIKIACEEAGIKFGDQLKLIEE